MLNGTPSTVTYPTELEYEQPVENYTQATQRDRKFCNQQLKVTSPNRCRKIDEISFLCGDKPWEFCDLKAAALLYLCIGTKGRQIFKSIHPYFIIEKRPLKELWRLIEELFIKTRNITYDRFVFFSLKQQKEELAENFYG